LNAGDYGDAFAESNISSLIGMAFHVTKSKVLSDAFVDVDGGGPSEQLTSALADHHAPREVTGSRTVRTH